MNRTAKALRLYTHTHTHTHTHTSIFSEQNLGQGGSREQQKLAYFLVIANDTEM